MKNLYHRLVEIVNYETKEAIFRFAEDADDMWTQVHVEISPLLWSRIMNPYHRRERLYRTKSYVGSIFRSRNNSTNYNDSPFRLVKFVPGPTSNISVNYRLEAVDEWFNPVKDSYGNILRDAVTGKIVAWDKTMRPVELWIREEVKEVIACSDVCFIQPNMTHVKY